MLSEEFGYIGRQRMPFDCNFKLSPPVNFNNKIHIFSEDLKLYELDISNYNSKEFAGEFNNDKILLKVYQKNGQSEKAFKDIVLRLPDLVPDFIRNITEAELNKIKGCKDYARQYIETFLGKIKIEIKEIEEEIFLKYYPKYLELYRTIPFSREYQRESIKKQKLEYDFYRFIRNYKNRLYDMKNHLKVLGILNQQEQIKSSILKDFVSRAQNDLMKYQGKLINISNKKNEEEKVSEWMVKYWLAIQKIRILKDSSKSDEIFNNQSLILILNSYNFNLAKIYLAADDFTNYLKYAKREFRLYADKIAVFNHILNQLIIRNLLDEAERLLKDRPDKNKENINHLYYRIHRKKKDLLRAFDYLKKEIELFPHRIELIPELISLNIMDNQDIDKYIKNLIKNDSSIIDINMNISKALISVKQFKNALEFTNRELEFFPENQKATLLKIEILTKLRYPENILLFDYKFVKNVLQNIDSNQLKFEIVSKLLQKVKYSGVIKDYLISIFNDLKESYLPETGKSELVRREILIGFKQGEPLVYILNLLEKNQAMLLVEKSEEFFNWFIRAHQNTFENIDQKIDRILTNRTPLKGLNFNIAETFRALYQEELADKYLNRELELFPNNQSAILTRLGGLEMNGADLQEIDKLSDSLNNEYPNSSLIKSRIYLKLKNYRKSWDYCKYYLLKEKNKLSLRSNLYLFAALNYVNVEKDELNELLQRNILKEAENEIRLFMQQEEECKHDELNENFENMHEYLSAYSTRYRVFKKVLRNVKITMENGDFEKSVFLLKILFSTFPAEQELMTVLNSLKEKINGQDNNSVKL
jgi:hypothetical protein